MSPDIDLTGIDLLCLDAYVLHSALSTSVEAEMHNNSALIDETWNVVVQEQGHTYTLRSSARGDLDGERWVPWSGAIDLLDLAETENPLPAPHGPYPYEVPVSSTEVATLQYLSGAPTYPTSGACQINAFMHYYVDVTGLSGGLNGEWELSWYDPSVWKVPGLYETTVSAYASGDGPGGVTDWSHGRVVF